MNAELREVFSRIKPTSDLLMVCPSADSITTFIARVSELKKESVQELQQYLLFPFITHVKSVEIEKNYELQRKLVDGMRVMLEKVTVNNFDMCMKIETALLQLIFDKTKTGMIAEVPEELKLSVMNTLTVLMLNVDNRVRMTLLKTQVPMLAQAVFVAVHLAKLEKLRSLRLAAINCVTAHTVTHAQLTHEGHIQDSALDVLVVDTLSSILPGVLAGLQDVATCHDNPGYAVIVAAIDAIHRILCIAMNDKHLCKKVEYTAEDFAKLIIEKSKRFNAVLNTKDLKVKHLAKRSPEWFAMAGDKLTLITESLVSLRLHDHFKVRKELAVFCSTLLLECNSTMQPSVPLALDVLISLCKDEYPQISRYCTDVVNNYFANAPTFMRDKSLDSLCDNLFTSLTNLPAVLNNIDCDRKLSALNLIHGYIKILSGEMVGRGGMGGQRLTAALGGGHRLRSAARALLLAASPRTDRTLLARHPARDLTSVLPMCTHWCKLRYLDSIECERRLQEICQLVGGAECADLVLDSLMEIFQQQRNSEAIYIMNWIGSAPNSSPSLAKRILDMYIEEDVWYQPLEVGTRETPITNDETLDVSVYNPRAWVKDSVPGLYEGAVETRYTDISYRRPRPRPPADRTRCATIGEAQRNIVLTCLLTEGVGVMANRLGDEFQPYLMKTLCLILERAGSEYSLVQAAGRTALRALAAHTHTHAHAHGDVAAFIAHNADYITNQLTRRLKKAWSCQSALQILSVVMEYSDPSILDCLYGIVQDVLVQSCDKYYENNLNLYLQVFLTFVECIRKWFDIESREPSPQPFEEEIDVLKDVREYAKNEEEAERLLSTAELESETGKSVEEMYREDLKKKEDNVLDYDDNISPEAEAEAEKEPPPQYVTVTIVIVKRALQFVSSGRRETAALALRVLCAALPALRRRHHHLLPLVHALWAPLVATCAPRDPHVAPRALALLLLLADLARDFIRARAVKEVLPHMYEYLLKSSGDSLLKDAGCAYRNSQAFQLQLAMLAALPHLTLNLGLQDEDLEDAMTCADDYLSNRQPRPLQASAVEFFKTIVDYDYGAAYHHLRLFCNNDDILNPPPCDHMKLEPVVGTPFRPINKEFENNINLIFDHIMW